jgi:hypothetical protein
MAIKLRVERPAQTIVTKIIPLSTGIKSKISNAFQEVVNEIKSKHL